MVGSSEDDDMKAAKAASLAAAGGGAVGRASQSSPRSRMTKRRQVTGGETTGDDYEDEEDEEEDDDDDSESAGSDEEAEDNRGRRRDEVKMEGTSAAAGAKAPGDSPGKHQHRREKRLAMNRESARARRKRKKLLIESLEGQVSSLTEQNSKLTATAEALVARVRQLESELAITASASRPAAAATSFMGPTGRDVSSLDSSLLGTLPPAQSSYLMLDPLRAQIRAEELHRARRSAAAGLGGYAFQGGGGFDAPLWETLPFRPQFLGNNPHLAGLAPTSMLAPSLRNTVRPPRSPPSFYASARFPSSHDLVSLPAF
jgi:hypothetical protein